MLVNLLTDCWLSPIGHFHYEVISPLLSENFSILLSSASRALTGITKKNLRLFTVHYFSVPLP